MRNLPRLELLIYTQPFAGAPRQMGLGIETHNHKVMANKTALVIGASRGIGRRIAIDLAK
jgi:hypothetical protein